MVWACYFQPELRPWNLIKFFFVGTERSFSFCRNMVVLRVHGEEFVFPTSLHHQMQPRIPQMNMMKVHIPFTFKLLETSRSSYSGKKQYHPSSVICVFQTFHNISLMFYGFLNGSRPWVSPINSTSFACSISCTLKRCTHLCNTRCAHIYSSSEFFQKLLRNEIAAI